MRGLIRIGAGALWTALIMFGGSLLLWLGTPLLWLWVGSQVQGATTSLSLALLVMAVGVIATVWVIAKLLGWLSSSHRANLIARGRDDPGHAVLETVLVVSAAVAVVVFVVWFLLFAGASPVPLGISL